MVKFRMRTKIMAVVTFIVMSAAVIFGGYDMQNAVATGGTDYVKYTFATGQTHTYNLPEIPTVNYASYAMRTMSLDDYVESRPLASSYNGVVEINGVGTGFIIGEHEIMTATHCVYDNNGFVQNCSIRIPNSNPYTDNGSTVIQGITVHIPQQYVIWKNDNIDDDTQGFQDYDYAIITVDESIDLTNYGAFLLGMGTNSLLSKQTPIHCMGYYENTIRLSDVNMNASIPINIGELSYDFNLITYNKTSGGPIYVESSFGVPGTSDADYQVKTYKTVISIVSGTNKNTYNEIVTCGTRIRPTIMQFAYDNDYL